eukprot:m.15830 g.15830  ORF g.15830 m.15830 type:complete len:406 (+) comp4529_c1_seq1:103-1320(+)
MAKACSGVVADVLFILFLSVGGGVFNHMRGEDGGMLSGKAWTGSCENPDDYDCLGYWLDHMYTRLLMALPTGALVHLITRDAKLSLVFTFLTFASIFIGWGTYFSLGYDEEGYNSRSGFLDWMLGRELQGWDWNRRWIRDFAGMGVRGLLWTLPAGHFLYRNGYSWKFSISGAVMPAIYTLANWPHGLWTADNWQPLECSIPSFSQDWAFSKGTPMAEFLFGAWLWLCLLLAIVPGPNVKTLFRGAVFNLYHVFAVLCAILFLASACWYATVKQKDHSNWGQTLAGLCISAVGLIVSISNVFYKRRRTASVSFVTVQHDERSPLLRPVDRSFNDVLNESDDDDDEYVISAYQETKSRRLRWVETFFSIASISATLMTLAFCFAALGWNWHSPRYCNDVHTTVPCP